MSTRITDTTGPKALAPEQPTRDIITAMKQEAEFQYEHEVSIDSVIHIYRAAVRQLVAPPAARIEAPTVESGILQYSDELVPRSASEKAAYLEGIEEGRMRAARDARVEAKTVEPVAGYLYTSLDPKVRPIAEAAYARWSDRGGSEWIETPLYATVRIEALEAQVAELREKAQAVVARWDSPLWKDVPHTGEFIGALRAVLAKTEAAK